MSAQDEEGEDLIHKFLQQTQKIVQDAEFIVQSLPNVEPYSVERALRLLQTADHVLVNLHDPYTSPEQIEDYRAILARVSLPLCQHRDAPPEPRNVGTSQQHTGRPGRPRYDINLERATELHNNGSSWEDVADALGVDRRTLYRHLERSGIRSDRPVHTEISDDDLDELIAQISLDHPLAGGGIVQGHLRAAGIDVPILRVQESLRRVDALGVVHRWGALIHRRVYRVRGANSLWHMDGNEKLRPWGFYVHGCVDGFSRLIIYLQCCNNKRSATVEHFFMTDGVAVYGWPSRVRGDFGKENNGVERKMIARRGEQHRAYLRGRSTHNIRMERTWRDVRKDSLEIYRQIFTHLDDLDLLDMQNDVHRVCLYIVFQPRIQLSLDRTRTSWNLHRLRTEHAKTPTALYELSKAKAINRGYWTSDPGDDIFTASQPGYGRESEDQPLPPVEELVDDLARPDRTEFASSAEEHQAGVFVNDDDEITAGRELLQGLDVNEDDGNWGIDVYCRAVLLMERRMGIDNT